ncbi:NRR repressor homolog 1 [Brachypodium distachyon]|uniref:NRR repressor homolog 1 n=1 Tax=Brachypodium distachyon TaxID=15368 RepID=I1HK51_BRADI|nr:NRR repressor homolog 1 [Brachypodium distachyon]KQK06655.1 hypothetical protein BRADI_2g27680v3 [Brachypodium distachyon]|eukprot:XP_010231491.1 NRR repressor homolog 1 [Brachypodium distachyon]
MDATGEHEKLQKAPLPSAGGASSPRAPLPDAVASGEDEQVERFYALLANIRALRDVCGFGGDGGGGSSRKRARAAEPPWRPAFRMEDFREPDEDDGVSAKKERRDGVERQRPESDAAEEDGEVVQGKDRVPASQNARVLAADQPA